MHGLFPVAGQVLEDRPARRIRERLEKIVRYGLRFLHDGNITIRLLVVNTFFRDHFGPKQIVGSRSRAACFLDESTGPALESLIYSRWTFGNLQAQKFTASYPCICSSNFLSLS